MTQAPRKLWLTVAITEYLADGTTRFTSRNATEGPKGWTSGDNGGKDHHTHRDESAARQALAGWLHSQAEKMAATAAMPGLDGGRTEEELREMADYGQQPGSPQFDGAAAYDAHLAAEQLSRRHVTAVSSASEDDLIG